MSDELSDRLKHVSLSEKSGKKLTPYQGKRRSFGHFKCKECGKSWMSGNSWANRGQFCKTCHVIVYPFKQRPLENPDGLDKSKLDKPHPVHLCEKCIEIGENCREYEYHDYDTDSD